MLARARPGGRARSRGTAPPTQHWRHGPARKLALPGRRSNAGNQDGEALPAASAADRTRQVASLACCESGELCIQIRQGFLENSLVARILCGTQFPHHSGTGEKDGFLLADYFEYFRIRRFWSYACATGLGHIDLRLDRLAFPTSGHAFILARWEAAGTPNIRPAGKMSRLFDML